MARSCSVDLDGVVEFSAIVTLEEGSPEWDVLRREIVPHRTAAIASTTLAQRGGEQDCRRRQVARRPFRSVESPYPHARRLSCLWMISDCRTLLRRRLRVKSPHN